MLAPQKNRAGQRVYRRKDVEMVLRIRDLLYEEKFTIAGAKKRLLDEMRGGARPTPPEEVAAAETSAPKSSAAHASSPTPENASPSVATTPQTRRVLRSIKSDLEDLLTRLNTDASI